MQDTGGRNVNPLQYSFLGNPKDRGAMGSEKSWTGLSEHTHVEEILTLFLYVHNIHGWGNKIYQRQNHVNCKWSISFDFQKKGNFWLFSVWESMPFQWYFSCFTQLSLIYLFDFLIVYYKNWKKSWVSSLVLTKYLCVYYRSHVLKECVSTLLLILTQPIVTGLGFWAVSWEICVWVKKQQLEPCREQLMGWGLRKEYNSAVCCHSVCLTSMLSTSWEMPDCMSYKPEPRQAEISASQICGWYHSTGRKWRGTKEPLDREEWMNWLKTKYLKKLRLRSWHLAPLLCVKQNGKRWK